MSIIWIIYDYSHFTCIFLNIGNGREKEKRGDTKGESTWGNID